MFRDLARRMNKLSTPAQSFNVSDHAATFHQSARAFWIDSCHANVPSSHVLTVPPAQWSKLKMAAKPSATNSSQTKCWSQLEPSLLSETQSSGNHRSGRIRLRQRCLSTTFYCANQHHELKNIKSVRLTLDPS